MSQLVTRCPYCSTSFHVSEQQLRAARGAVRCGSCLQVFRADENIIFTEGEEQPATSPAVDDFLDDDNFLIHDDLELDDDDDSDDELPRARKPDARSADKPSRKEEGAPTQQSLIADAFGEEQWQELSSDEVEDDDFPLGEGFDTDQDNPWAEEMAREAPLEKPISGERDKDPLDSWDHEPAHDIPSDLPQGPDREASGQEQLAPEDSELLPGTRIGEYSGDGIDAHQQADAPLLERDQLISAIGPAPLEVTWQPKRHNRVPGWLWGVTALLLLVALAAQTAYFRFDTLSKREPWRPMYAKVCPLLGCTLPAQRDIQALRTSNLVVRSHPQLAGALAVEAVLLNTAPFQQPFPNLELRFTDLKNSPVASRRFTPAEYLKGELAGRRLMPSGNPVHIGLEIVDPGQEAVNYELRIAPQ